MEQEKVCPKCAERVKAAALLCRFCGHTFSPPAPSAVTTPPITAYKWGSRLAHLWKRKWIRYSVLGIVGINLLSSLLGHDSNHEGVTASSAGKSNVVAPQVAPVATVAPVGNGSTNKPLEVDPGEERAKNKSLIVSIEKRLAENKTNLKKFYATPEHVKLSGADLQQLTAIALSRGLSKAKDDQQQANQAKALAVQVAAQIREMYASSIEQAFVKDGKDLQVRVGGKNNERITITYALMNQPLVYQFQNEMGMSNQAKEFGFKRIVYTNGFQSDLGKSWTIDL